MGNWASFHFWGRLQPLTTATAGEAVAYPFWGHPAIKDSIEALGVPHTEVDLIIVGGISVGFGYRLQDDDRVAVYPFGLVPNVAAPRHLSPPLPERAAFILDVHLGKLARRLRMLGFDCRYRTDYADPQIIDLALDEGLIILTRDRGLLKHARVSRGYLVGSSTPETQVLEVLERYRLHRQIRALYRCPCCNGLLQLVGKEEIRHRLLPKTARYYQHFHQCCSCRQIYWRGSHYAKIERWIRNLMTPPDL